MRSSELALIGITVALAACPHRVAPTPRPDVSWVRAFGDGTAAAIRGLDVDDSGIAYVAVTKTGAAPETTVSSIGKRGEVRWTWTIAAGGGPIASTGKGVVCAIAPAPGAHEIAIGGAPVKLRGEAGGVLVALDGKGAPVWHLAASATEWAVIAAIDGHASGDVVAVGSFAGTLRIGDEVVTSAGNSDGFAVRVDATGAVTWLVRMGADAGDALTAVAVMGDKDIAAIAVAGSVTGAADFRGTPLVSHNPRLASTDLAVAWLDGTGLPTWGDVLGGDLDDVATGVTFGTTGGLEVVGTVREVVTLDGESLVVRGKTDAIAVTYGVGGDRRGATLLGANDSAGARGIVIEPYGSTVATGWFSGVVRGPAGDVTADGGDDAFVATVDKRAHFISIEPITGPGREEIVGVASSRGGFAIAVAHTAELRALGERFAAPAEPTGGIVVIARSYYARPE